MEGIYNMYDDEPIALGEISEEIKKELINSKDADVTLKAKNDKFLITIKKDNEIKMLHVPYSYNPTPNIVDLLNFSVGLDYPEIEEWLNQAKTRNTQPTISLMTYGIAFGGTRKKDETMEKVDDTLVESIKDSIKDLIENHQDNSCVVFINDNLKKELLEASSIKLSVQEHKLVFIITRVDGTIIELSENYPEHINSILSIAPDLIEVMLEKEKIIDWLTCDRSKNKLPIIRLTSEDIGFGYTQKN